MQDDPYRFDMLTDMIMVPSGWRAVVRFAVVLAAVLLIFSYTEPLAWIGGVLLGIVVQVVLWLCAVRDAADSLDLD